MNSSRLMAFDDRAVSDGSFLTEKQVLFHREAIRSSPRKKEPLILWAQKYDKLMVSHADGRVVKEISGNSGVGEGETISVLKDFRTLMRKLLFSGHSSWLRHLGCMSGNYSARFSVIEVITSVIHLPILSIISCNFAM